MSSQPASDTVTIHELPQPAWRRALDPLIDLLFPPACFLCMERLASSDQTVCADCRDAWEAMPRPRCSICGSIGARRKKSGGCDECPPAPIGFETARGAFRYIGPAAETVKTFKFGGRVALGPVMGRAMLPMFMDEIVMETGPVDYLIPVPLHFTRFLMRGFNQSLLISRELSRLTGVPTLERVLHRIKRTRKQSLLDPKERHANVLDAFAVSDPNVVRGKRIILIDDVYTTGATINACGLALNASGAESVNAYTFARA